MISEQSGSGRAILCTLPAEIIDHTSSNRYPLTYNFHVNLLLISQDIWLLRVKGNIKKRISRGFRYGHLCWRIPTIIVPLFLCLPIMGNILSLLETSVKTFGLIRDTGTEFCWILKFPCQFLQFVIFLLCILHQNSPRKQNRFGIEWKTSASCLCWWS